MKLEFLNMFWVVRNLEHKREASIPKRKYIWREYLRPLFCENKVLNIRVRLQTILTKKGMLRQKLVDFSLLCCLTF